MRIFDKIGFICIKLITNTVKILLSLILLSALLLKMGGYYAILSFEREEIREKVEQKIIKSLKKSELICIIADAENLPKITWERPEKEFSFEGNLYDVVHIEEVSGITYYYCLSDKDETILEAKIDKLLENQTESSSIGGNAKLVLYLIAQPLITQQNFSFHFHYFSPKNTFIFPDLTISFTSNFVSTLKQPPQLF